MNLRFSAPAKINLYLRVVGRRVDGYHLLDSAMAFFPWFDRLEVMDEGDEITLQCRPQVTSAMEENLAWRAASLLRQRGRINRGVQLHLFKEIPHGAGLGGGSSDAALVLLALNRLWGLDWPLDQLCEVGLELGADIPFFLGGMAAHVSGIGEQLTMFPDCPELELVVVYPGIPLATASVYRNITETMVDEFKKSLPPSAQGTKNKLNFHNDLQHIACRLTPEINRGCEFLRACGATTTLMSGSGSAVFGIFNHQTTALSACEHISRVEPHWQVRYGRTFNVHPFDREWRLGIE
ncbi:MAG: 4-(cytidine 5'-diphospho)-2-C-methyl-D-erythritol kinase [Magnetococcales bacterium]|nr:4-(cytidine 5'-diphospho)-2-C-methyl-D-erythritol kinase [Magnetococcales bacterium]